MSIQISNSERLTRFRDELEAHRQMTAQALDRIAADVDRLGSQWKDDQFTEFRRSLQVTSERMRDFLARTTQHLAHLAEMAEASRAVEAGRMSSVQGS